MTTYVCTVPVPQATAKPANPHTVNLTNTVTRPAPGTNVQFWPRGVPFPPRS